MKCQKITEKEPPSRDIFFVSEDGEQLIGERIAGVPNNGEPANSWWKSEAKDNQLIMSVNAPIEELSVSRKISLMKDVPVFLVDESLQINSTQPG